MENSSIGGFNNQLNKANTLQQAQMTMFKKTLNNSANNVLSMVESVTQPQVNRNQPNLGQKVDIRA